MNEWDWERVVDSGLFDDEGVNHFFPYMLSPEGLGYLAEDVLVGRLRPPRYYVAKEGGFANSSGDFIVVEPSESECNSEPNSEPECKNLLTVNVKVATPPPVYPEVVINLGNSFIEVELFCPLCGSMLVLRKNRRTGAEFYGCSSYPDCKYSVGIGKLKEALKPQLREK